jgi:hypothetical protein
VALISLATAALTPSWASEITSLTPRSPRRRGLRKNSVQNVSASEGLRPGQKRLAKRRDDLRPLKPVRPGDRQDDARAPARPVMVFVPFVGDSVRY